MGMGVYACLSLLFSRQLLVRARMYRIVNTAERLQLHKVRILLSIMEYFVLKTDSYSHTTTPFNLFKISSLPIAPLKD